MHILDRNQIPSHATKTFSADLIAGVSNGIALQYLLNSRADCWREKAISATLIVQTLSQRLHAFPGVTCSVCCPRGKVDIKSSRRWRSGDGKIISVAEEKEKKKFPLSLSLSPRSQTNTPGLNPKTMLMKACKHLEQWDVCLWNKDAYLYFLKDCECR